MEEQVQRSFWRNLSIASKLQIGFGFLVFIIVLLGAISLYTLRLEEQAFEEFAAFEEAVAIAESMEISFLNARRFGQTFFARWNNEGFDVAVENYIVRNQAAIQTMREEAISLEIRLASEGHGSEEVAALDALLSELDEYELQLSALIADVDSLGFVNTGLEGEFRTATSSLENIIVNDPALYITFLNMRRHEKDFISRRNVDDANTTITFANQLSVQIEVSGRSTSEITSLVSLVDDYIAAFSEYVVVLQRIDANNLQLDEQVETIIVDLDTIIADEQAEAAAASEQFTAIENVARAVNIITLVLGLVFGVSFSFVVGRSIIDGIAYLTQTAEAIAGGDFSQRVNVTSSDEMGQLGTSFNQMVEAVVTRNRDVQAIVDVAARIATILDEQRLLQDVTDLTKERFALYHAHIYLLNETGDTLQLTAGAGYVGRQMVAEKRIIDIDNPESIVARTARNRQSSIVNNVRDSETFLPHPLLPETRSELAVALVARGQVLGVLDVQSDRVDYFDNNILAVMQTLATQVSNALSNARLFDSAQRNSRHAQALTTIQQNMQAATDMDEMLRTTARELAKALRVPYAAIELTLDAKAQNKNNLHPVEEN